MNAIAEKTLPNFLVVGTARAGTTSMHSYLSQHPEIFMSKVKEPKFFCFEGGIPAWKGYGDSQAVERYRFTKLDDYASLFEGSETARAVGESTPWYLYSEKAAQRIRHYVPNAKLIVILRNPVFRALSNYQMNRKTGREPLDSFYDALMLEEERIQDSWSWTFHYAKRGRYAEQLQVYYKYFHSDQIHILSFDDFVERPQETVQACFAFLGVESEYVVDTSTRHHSSHRDDEWRGWLAKLKLFGHSGRGKAHKPDEELEATIDNAAKRYLEDYFRDDLEDLQSLVRFDVSKWKS